MPETLKSIQLSWDLPHAPAKVWRALTDPKLVAQWLMETDMPPATGKAFSFRLEPTPYWDGIVHSEILELEPLKRLRYTWNSKAAHANFDSVVTWTLHPTEGGTRLELEHSGFKADNGQAYGGAKLGWERNVGVRMSALLKTFN